MVHNEKKNYDGNKNSNKVKHVPYHGREKRKSNHHLPPTLKQTFWHNHHMAKTKIKVRPHYRNGQYIAAYLRSHTPSTTLPQNPNGATQANLVGVAEETLNNSEKRTSLVDRNGKFFDLTVYPVVIRDADFSGYNFENLDVGEIEFINSNFTGAKFSNSRLAYINMKNCIFTGAKFEKSNLNFRSIQETSMAGTEFAETSISGTGLRNPYEEEQEYRNYVVKNSDFSDATFKNSTIDGLWFANSNLQGTKIEGTQITNMRTLQVQASGMILVKSSIDEVVMGETDLRGALIYNSTIKSNRVMDWEKINLENAIIKNSELEGVGFYVPSFSYVDENYYSTKLGKWWLDRRINKRNKRLAKKAKRHWKNTQVENSTFTNCKFASVRLADAKLTNSQFVDSTFFKTDMTNMDVRGNSFAGSSFFQVKGVGLQAENTNFSNVSFGKNNEKSDMRNSNFTNAVFDDAEIGNTNLRGSIWKGAKTDKMHVFKIDNSPLTVVENSSGEITTLNQTSYEHYSLYDAAKKIDATDKAFEFLVVSGSIDVRHNLTKQRIEKDFDPSINHVPVWQMQNLLEAAGKTAQN